MKLSALLVLFAASSVCLAQSMAATPQAIPVPGQKPQVGVVLNDRINQANCPVVLTRATLTPHLMLLKTLGESAGNGLDLEFQNVSGKSVYSMEFSVQLLARKTIYDLTSTPVQLHLTAYGARSVDETFAQLRHLSLPEGMNPSVVQHVALEQVFFEDGTAWAAKSDASCGIGPDQTLPVAK